MATQGRPGALGHHSVPGCPPLQPRAAEWRHTGTAELRHTGTAAASPTFFFFFLFFGGLWGGRGREDQPVNVDVG